MTASIYESYDRFRTAMHALSMTMQKTDRILTGDMNITVHPATTKETRVMFPAFSFGYKIIFNYDRFKDIGSAPTLIALMGANYHELAHILFTPRYGSALRTHLLEGRDQLQIYWNILEDQRIESLYRAMYPSIGKYFTQMVIEFLVKEQSSWPLGYAMVYGRKFVPLDIRQAFADKWAGTDDERREIENLIDEYKRFPFDDLIEKTYIERTPHNLRPLQIVDRYAEILQAISARMGTSDLDAGCSIPENKEQMKPKKGSSKDTKDAIEQMEDQEEAQDDLEEQDEDGSGFWDDIDEDDEEEGSEDGSEGEGDSSGEDLKGDEDDGDASGRGGAEDDSDSADKGSPAEGGEDDSDSDADGNDGDSDSSANGASGDLDGETSEADEGDEDDFDLESALEEILDNVKNSSSIKDDVEQLLSAMNNPFSLDVETDYTKFYLAEVTSDMVAAANDTHRELSRLYAQLEPGWHYGSNQGRLNAERWSRDHNIDEAFDEWDEGREQDSGLEVVMLLDTSPSMANQKIIAAGQSVWSIKRACDLVEASVSVLSFSHVTETIYRRHDKAEMGQWRKPGLGDSTVPMGGLHIARRILTESDAPNKLLVVVTDGHWSGLGKFSDKIDPDEDYESVIGSIPGTKLMIAIATLNHSSAQFFDIAETVASASDVAPLVSKAITKIISSII